MILKVDIFILKLKCNKMYLFDEIINIDILDDYIQSEEWIKYTEHNNRYGIQIEDKNIIEHIKARVLNKVSKYYKHSLKISAIYLCKDIAPFCIPYHFDADYKLVSCIIYLDDCSKFHYIHNDVEKSIKSRINRLVFFSSTSTFHCVKYTNDNRLSLQFYFSIL